MNAELLLEHFHRLGEAAEAIPRLRALIIDLAVKGKLTASECSTADAARTERALKLGMSKIVDAIQRTRWTASSDVQTEEERFDAPTGWHWARLNDTGLYVNGVAFKPSDWQAEGMPIIRIQNLSKPNAAINYTTGEYDEANLAPPGTLLVSWSATLDAFIWERETAVVNQHIFRVFPNEAALDKRFLYWLLKDAIKILEAGEDMRGLTMRHIRRGPFLDFPVAIPPLPEQHRIVAKVEELMALCDRLEAAQQQREAERTRLTAAAWQAVVQAEAPAEVSFALEQLPALTTRPAQVKALRQTILDLAVRGRLVEQEEGDEPAEVLLERIRKEKERLVKEGIQKPERRRGNTANGDVDENLPHGWAPTTLGEVALKITDGAHKTPTYVEKGVPFISVKDFSGGKLDLSNTRFIPPQEHKALYERCDPRRGDILLGRIGTLGCPVIVDTDVEFSLFVSVGLLRFDQKHLDIRYIKYLLESPLVRQEFDRIKIGGATHTNKLNLGDLHTIAFPLPPLAEQRRIVAKVVELMALCDGLEAALEAGEALRGNVLEAVVRSESGGTEPPAPVRVRQLPMPKVRAPRYEEAEVELAVAAEPVGHTGALQAVVRRGPGRPPKNGALTSTAARSIEAYLHAHPGWHGKAAILEATGVDAGAWNAAIKELLEGGKVERQGEKKGARYRAA